MYLGSNVHFSGGPEVVSAVHQCSGSIGYSTAVDDEIRNRFRQLMMTAVSAASTTITTTTATPTSIIESHDDYAFESTGTDSNIIIDHAINGNKNNHTHTPFNDSSLFLLSSTATQPMRMLTILLEEYVRDIAGEEEKYVTVFLPLYDTQYTALEEKYNNNKLMLKKCNNNKSTKDLKSPVNVKVNAEASSMKTSSSVNTAATTDTDDVDGDCNCTILYSFTNMLTSSSI